MKDQGLDTKAVLKRLREGDPGAIELLFNRYYDNLFYVANYYVRRDVWAEEIVSDLFHHLWEKKEQLPEISSISSYLFVSVKNASLNFLRKESQHPETGQLQENDDPVDDYSPEQQFCSKEISDNMEKAVERLPEQCKLVFLMVREEGMKYKEVADMLDLSPKTVENQMANAIKKIFHFMKSYTEVK